MPRRRRATPTARSSSPPCLTAPAGSVGPSSQRIPRLRSQAWPRSARRLNELRTGSGSLRIPCGPLVRQSTQGTLGRRCASSQAWPRFSKDRRRSRAMRASGSGPWGRSLMPSRTSGLARGPSPAMVVLPSRSKESYVVAVSPCPDPSAPNFFRVFSSPALSQRIGPKSKSFPPGARSLMSR